MPRYYFDLCNGDGETSDPRRADTYPPPAGVRTEAIKTLADVAHDELPNSDRQIVAVKVRDETGSLRVRGKPFLGRGLDGGASRHIICPPLTFVVAQISLRVHP